AVLAPSEKTAITGIEGQSTGLNRQRRAFGIIQAIYDVGPPPATYLLKRGNYEAPGKEVQPGLLRVLSDSQVSGWMPAGKPGAATRGGRSALARWWTDARSPASALFARIIVNRIWLPLIGQGIAPTADNFGLTGTPPTHPELLEWLAREFVSNGWRVKPIIKLIMTSAGYRQGPGNPPHRAPRRPRRTAPPPPAPHPPRTDQPPQPH